MRLECIPCLPNVNQEDIVGDLGQCEIPLVVRRPMFSGGFLRLISWS